METTLSAHYTLVCPNGHDWRAEGTVTRALKRRGPHRPRMVERNDFTPAHCPECGAACDSYTRRLV